MLLMRMPSNIVLPPALPWKRTFDTLDIQNTPAAPPMFTVPAMPGVMVPMFESVIVLVGKAWSSSSDTLFCCTTFCTSTSGLLPDTVTVSSRDPTDSSTLIAAAKPPVRMTPSRRSVLKPGSENVRV